MIGISYEIKHYHILCILLVRDLTAIVLLSGLGIENKKTGTILFHTINSLCLIQTVHLPIKSRTLHGLGQEIGGTFLAGSVAIGNIGVCPSIAN